MCGKKANNSKTCTCCHKSALARGFPLQPLTTKGVIIKKMNDKKTEVLKLRISKTEKEMLNNFCQMTDKTQSEFVRRMIFSRPPKVISENLNADELKQFFLTITKIGNFQKKLNKDLLNAGAENIEIELDVLKQIKEQIENSRAELMKEIIDTKKILSEILEELK